MRERFNTLYQMIQKMASLEPSLTNEEKIQTVCDRLDGVDCLCGGNPYSPFSWAHGRHSVLCSVCDADLIAKYGSKETIPGYIDLNKWSLEGRVALDRRIDAFNNLPTEVLMQKKKGKRVFSS
jgi:hypothetical protein